MPEAFPFEVTHRSGAARAGVLVTPHGAIETPAFAPVGTRGAVKSVTHRDLVGLGAQILLANTYHLHLRPGGALVGRAERQQFSKLSHPLSQHAPKGRDKSFGEPLT